MIAVVGVGINNGKNKNNGGKIMADRISESVITTILNKIYMWDEPLTQRQQYILEAYVKQEGSIQGLITHLEEAK